METTNIKKRKIKTKSKEISIFALLFFLFFSILTPQSVNAASNTNILLQGTVDYDMSYQVLELVNKERENAGLGSLSMDANQVNSANIRARECILKYSHRRTVGADWSTLFPSGWSDAGENLGLGYDSASSVVKAWMDSPTHRDNIMNPSFKTIGVGVFKYVNPVSGKTVYTFAQHFSNNSLSGDSRSGKVEDIYDVGVDLGFYPLDFNLYFDREDEGSEIYANLDDKLTPTLKVSGAEMFGYDYVIANPKSLTWDISNPDIAEITDNGAIKATAIGTTTISAFTAGHEYEKTFSLIVRKSIRGTNINLVNPRKYTGDFIKPKMTVKDGDKELVEGEDYKVWYSDNIYVGDAHIHIEGIGEYGGEKVIHFSIYDESTVVKEKWWIRLLRFIGLY